MATINKDLLDEILALPSDMRTQLVDILIKSLNVPLQKEIDELWAKEAERRLEEYKKGNIKAIPAEEVFKSIRERLHK